MCRPGALARTASYPPPPCQRMAAGADAGSQRSVRRASMHHSLLSTNLKDHQQQQTFFSSMVKSCHLRPSSLPTPARSRSGSSSFTRCLAARQKKMSAGQRALTHCATHVMHARHHGRKMIPSWNYRSVLHAPDGFLGAAGSFFSLRLGPPAPRWV